MYPGKEYHFQLNRRYKIVQINLWGELSVLGVAADAAASRVRSLSSPPLAARYRAAVAAASRVRSLPTSPPLAACLVYMRTHIKY